MDYGHVYPIAGAEEDLADRIMRLDSEKQDVEWQNQALRRCFGWQSDPSEETISADSDPVSKQLGFPVRIVSVTPDEKKSIKRTITESRRRETPAMRRSTERVLGPAKKRARRVEILRGLCVMGSFTN